VIEPYATIGPDALKCNQVAVYCMSGSESNLLTDTQRKALTENFDILDNSQKTRLRTRIIDILKDFTTLGEMPEEERANLFKKAVSGGLNRKQVGDEVLGAESEFRNGLIALFRFVISGLRGIGMEYEGPNGIERLLQNAIMAAEGWGETDVDVDITVERLTTPEQIRAKFDAGDPLTDAEIGYLVREDMITGDELEEMKSNWELPAE
jgi:hypothetical protein